jgi:hypothetical protein
MTRERSETVSFRLQPALVRLVDLQRARVGNISRGDWVKGLISNHLYREEQEDFAGKLGELQESLESIQASQSEFRRLGLRCVHLLLATIADIDSKEAKQLIRHRVLRK